MARDHYLPEFYQKGFVNPATQKLWQYPKSGEDPVHGRPDSFGAISGYWSGDTETRVTSTFERFGNRALRKLRAHEDLSPTDRLRLCFYMFNLIQRTPKGRQRMLEMAPRAWERGLVRAKELYERAKIADPDHAERYDQALHSLDEYSPNNDKYNELWENILAPKFGRNFARVAYQMCWTFVVAGKYRGFVTTDNPVQISWDTGIKNPYGQIWFPLSKDTALIAHWDRNRKTGVVLASNELIDLHNKQLVFDADRYIYYPTLTNWIPALIKRISRHKKI